MEEASPRVPLPSRAAGAPRWLPSRKVRSTFREASEASYFPTTVNFGFATTSAVGADHAIARAPAGSERSRPRTRYHHVPGVNGSVVEVAYVRIGVAATLNG